MTENSNPDTTNTQPVPAAPLLQELLAQLTELAAAGTMLVARHDVELKQEKRWAWFRRAVFATAILIGLLSYLGVYGSLLGVEAPPSKETVGVVHIDGAIGADALANAERVGGLIRAACENEDVRGLMLRISSPGGSPSEAERIARAVNTCRTQNTPKPIIAVIDTIGASAAYMIAIQADRIYANKYAMVGSIGAVMTRFDAHEGLARLGVREQQFASGPLKGMGSTWQVQTKEQLQVSQAMVDDVAALFRAEVQAKRGERLTPGKTDLYTGRTWLGEEALSLGLIDGVAVYEDVLETEFKGLRPHQFVPKRTLQDHLALSSMVDAVADRMIESLQQEPTWR